MQGERFQQANDIWPVHACACFDLVLQRATDESMSQRDAHRVTCKYCVKAAQDAGPDLQGMLRC